MECSTPGSGGGPLETTWLNILEEAVFPYAHGTWRHSRRSRGVSDRYPSIFAADFKKTVNAG